MSNVGLCVGGPFDGQCLDSNHGRFYVRKYPPIIKSAPSPEAMPVQQKIPTGVYQFGWGIWRWQGWDDEKDQRKTA